jgi:hypothetical protein
MGISVLILVCRLLAFETNVRSYRLFVQISQSVMKLIKLLILSVVCNFTLGKIELLV